MRSTKSLYDRRSGPLIDPQRAFAAALLAGLVFWIGLFVLVPADLMMPAVTTLLLVLAAGFAVIAWRQRSEDPAHVTYTDVAGALTLIGLCAGATIDPDQMVRIVASDSTQP